MKTVLVTGGAGYIGSHTCLSLLRLGHDVVCVDDLSNSSRESVARVRALAGRDFTFVESDLRDGEALGRVFAGHPVTDVIHFAGLKAVGESVADPLRYFRVNLGSTVSLLERMKEAGVTRLIFSSSATVYGVPSYVPLDEGHPLSATNPYGRTKLFIEEMCRDLAASDPSWKIFLLRYFNPVGADPSGDIGEDPAGEPNNLVPYVLQTAVGRRDAVRVFGSDYPTPDGTGVRDYVHVVDLAEGHVAALDRLDGVAGCEAVNLGTGRGYSVLQVIEEMTRAVGREIPYVKSARRPGDVAECYASTDHAAARLGWRAVRGLAEMCRDSWNWQSRNPDGYPK